MADEKDPNEGSADFLNRFLRLCAKTDFLESDKEEQERYANHPYVGKITNWLWFKHDNDEDK